MHIKYEYVDRYVFVHYWRNKTYLMNRGQYNDDRTNKEEFAAEGLWRQRIRCFPQIAVNRRKERCWPTLSSSVVIQHQKSFSDERTTKQTSNGANETVFCFCRPVKGNRDAFVHFRESIYELIIKTDMHAVSYKSLKGRRKLILMYFSRKFFAVKQPNRNLRNIDFFRSLPCCLQSATGYI